VGTGRRNELRLDTSEKENSVLSLRSTAWKKGKGGALAREDGRWVDR